jgi:chromosomal replication initiation ATPase DnaA
MIATSYREFARTHVSGQQVLAAPQKPTVRFVFDHVCAMAGLTLNDLRKATRRDPTLVKLRQTGMYLARTLTDASFPEIAAFFGFDHCNVMYACRRTKERMQTDTLFAQSVVKAERLILSSFREYAKAQGTSHVR